MNLTFFQEDRVIISPTENLHRSVEGSGGKQTFGCRVWFQGQRKILFLPSLSSTPTIPFPKYFIVTGILKCYL